jgi:hypothetical protein
MNLFDRLITTPAREDAGADTQNRFNYQHSWAIRELLQEHLKGRSYAFGFEMHEDVIQLNAEESPTVVIFVQVKTRGENCWVLDELLKARGSRKSIVHKLLASKGKFPGTATRFVMVSNMQFEFLQRIGELTAWELSGVDKNKIINALARNNIAISDSDLKWLSFSVSDLSLTSHEVELKGHVQEFLEKATRDDASVRYVEAFLRILRDSIRLKSAVKLSAIGTIQDLLDRKCLTKSQIDECLNGIKKQLASDVGWDLVSKFLVQDGVDQKLIIRIGREWESFRMRRLDSANLPLQKMIEDIRRIISEVPSDVARNTDKLLTAVLRTLLSEKLIPLGCSHDFVNAAILSIHYE